MTPIAMLISHPVLPWWIVLPCGVAFAILAWMTYGKCKLTTAEKATLWTIRMLAFLLIAWMLLQQSFRTATRTTEKPAVAIVTDFSASMEDNPMESDETRAARALKLLKSKEFQSLSDKARVFHFGIGDELRDNASDGEFNEPNSPVSQQLERILARFRGDRLAAVVLLSDGLDRSPEPIDAAALKVPFYVPELEESGEPPRGKALDFAVGEISYPKRMTVNWKTNIGVAVTRVSGEKASAMPVRLLKDGVEIQSENAVFAENESVRRVSFQIEPTEIGSFVYQIEISPPEDDDNGNNRKNILIDVTDSRTRVLYLEGTPRWEFKYLKRSLLSEKNLQLTAFVRYGKGGFISFDETNSGEAMPKLTAESLRQYKALILGDLNGTVFTPEEAADIRKFVENGGSMLMLGGVNAYKEDGIAFIKEFSQIMPASYSSGGTMREGRFSVDFTPEGRALQAFAPLAEEGRFPPVLSLFSPVKTGPFTSTYLAATDGTPLLLARQAGQGRTAMILSDSLWRWQMGSADAGGKGLYGRFITQLFYWLCPEQKTDGTDDALQFVLAEREVSQHQRVALAVVGDAGASGNVTCTVKAPSGKTLAMPMLPAKISTEFGLTQAQNGFKCEFTPAETGTYSLEAANGDGSRRTTAVLLSKFPETERTGAVINRAFLHSLAENSGGRWTPWGSQKRLLDGLKLEENTVEITSERPIWNHWAGLAVLMSLFCLEWWLRRKWDLV
ncbi:MAG: hypothetical protein J5833_07115 [Victivallales bacterium]|nr:hypothetical protein [Victivallales bacterium]